jgi:hypothetical protein
MPRAATLENPARGVAPHERKEGTITKAIEQSTSAVPSGVYLNLRRCGLSSGCGVSR